MINQTTKEKIEALQKQYLRLAKGKKKLLKEIALAEIPEMVYHSNAIENSTLSLEDTETILAGGHLRRKVDVREIFEAKNLAKITEMLLDKEKQRLTVELILELHKTLLMHINERIAGRFRNGKEWVRVGNHPGAHPKFVYSLVTELLNKYEQKKTGFFWMRLRTFMLNLKPFTHF